MSRFPKLTETFILREILELERQGQPVMILPLLRERQVVRHADVDRVADRVHAVPLLSLPILSANLQTLRRSPGRYLKTWWLAVRGAWGSANLFIGALGIFPKAVYFARLIERQGIRHVHAHYATHPALAALIISELTGASFSFTAHAHDIFVHTKMLGEKLRRARFIVTVSEFNKRYLLRFNPAASEKIHVVRCGIELARYKPQPRRRAGEPFTLLCVASLQPYKGLPHLIKACARLRPMLGRFRCLIVGEGFQRKSLERLMTQLDLQETVRLLGAQPQERVAGLFSQADLFVLPSVVATSGQMEGVPVAIMEAMASGLPVVASRLSGIPELVEDGRTGILVPPTDEQALAEAIATLASHEELRLEMGRRGRQIVEAQFDLAANVERLRTLYASVGGGWEDQVKELIQRHVHRAAPHPEGDRNVVRVHLRAQRSGHDSDVYQVMLQNGSRHASSLILKRHRSAPAAQREHEALSWLWDAFTSRSDRYAVPRPLGFFPEHAALLMEPCQGERLDRSLRWTRARATPWQPARLCRRIGACGEWLGLFHQITERPGDPSAIYRRIEQEFEEELASCCALGLDMDLARHVAQSFTARKRAAFSGTHRLVGRHCDFAPYNIFLSPNRMTAIDFEGLQYGIIYDDLCYFLGMLESTSWYHLSRPLRRRLTASFLDGYRRHGRIDRESHEAFMLAAMVKLMGRSPLLQGPASGWRHRLKRATRVRLYQRWFEERTR